MTRTVFYWILRLQLVARLRFWEWMDRRDLFGHQASLSKRLDYLLDDYVIGQSVMTMAHLQQLLVLEARSQRNITSILAPKKPENDRARLNRAYGRTTDSSGRALNQLFHNLRVLVDCFS